MPAIFTNNMNLPEPLYRALMHSNYKKRGFISVTSLIDSALPAILKEKHDYYVDVADNVWSLFGSSMHGVLETSADRLIEHDKASNQQARYSSEFKMDIDIEGRTLTGTTDLVQHYPEIVYDYKQTSVYKVINTDAYVCPFYGTVIRSAHKKENLDWIRQLNIYAWILRKKYGFVPKALRIIAILKDWKRAEAKKGIEYPQKPVVVVDIPIYGDEVEQYITSRMRYHAEQREIAERLGADNIAHCSEKERWTQKGFYRIYKNPGDSKSTKNFYEATSPNARAEATVFHAQLLQQHKNAKIVYTPGVDTRCEEFCEVKMHCHYYRKLHNL